MSTLPAATHVTIQWLKIHRHDNNRFLAVLGVGIILTAALFALTDLARVSVILAWSALSLLALALPWTDWIHLWTREADPHAWDRREAHGTIRPPIG